MVTKTAKTLIMIALVLAGLTLVAGASSSSGGFNWSSITGYVIIAAIIIIIIAAALLFLSRIGNRKGKP